MQVSNIDTGAIEIKDGEFFDAKLWFDAPGTVAAGTILARPTSVDVVDEDVDVTADGENTGDGTVTAIVVSTDETVVGEYTLTCSAAAANGGTFQLRNPSGTLLATLVMTPAAGGSTVFVTSGLQITITDGDANFAVDDLFTLEVTATGDSRDDVVVPFDPAGSDGYNAPKYVLTYPVPSRTELSVDVDADGGNTGDGTAAASIVGDVSELGQYRLVCTTATANGGTFTLSSPTGVVLGTVVLTVGAGTTSVFQIAGFRLAITDGDTNFALDDEFVLTVLERLAVVPVRVLAQGRINRDRLIIAKDGDGDNITAAHCDALRSYGIVPSPVSQLAQLDNQ
jgi:hypothetical protein